MKGVVVTASSDVLGRTRKGDVVPRDTQTKEKKRAG